jgi:hypothetical protein
MFKLKKTEKFSMVRLVGASALALTMVAAGAPSAQAAHRHHAAYATRYFHHGREAAQALNMADRLVAFDQDGRSVAPAYASANTPARPDAVDRRRGVRTQAADTRVMHDMPRVAGGRPSAWCGWYARGLVGQDPGPAYNLARNWAHWGRAASPGVGVVVVWAHHVGMITGQTADGQWIVRSGNDGGGVARERPRSISGAIAFRAS